MMTRTGHSIATMLSAARLKLLVCSLVMGLAACSPEAPPSQTPTVRITQSTARPVTPAEPVSPQRPPLAPGGEIVLQLQGERGRWLGIPKENVGNGNYAKALYDVWGIDRLVFAIGKGFVLRSIDGGATWSSHALDRPADANKLWGPSENELYLAHSRGLSRSTDTGLTWQPLELGDSLTDPLLMSVWGSGPNDVWVASYHGTVLHSVDRGRSWKHQRLDGADSLGAGWSTSAGVFIGGQMDMPSGGHSHSGCVWRSQDMGAHWTKMPVSLACRQVRHLAEGSDGSLYLGCSAGLVAHSANHGVSWEKVGDLEGIELLDMDVVGPGSLVLVGRNQTFQTSNDNGRSWKTTTPLGEDYSALNGFWRAADGTSFLAATSTNGGGGWLIRRR